MKKNKLEIPKEFDLFGETINIEFDRELANRENANGMAHYRYSKIVLQTNEGANPRKHTQIEQSYLHEVVHFILDAMNEEELRTNEKFVNLFASLLHQVLITSKYK